MLGNINLKCSEFNLKKKLSVTINKINMIYDCS